MIYECMTNQRIEGRANGRNKKKTHIERYQNVFIIKNKYFILILIASHHHVCSHLYGIIAY